MDASEISLGGVHVLTVHEERIDGRTGIELARAIAGMVERGHAKIIVDLEAVRFMDSTGLAYLVRSLKLVGPRGDLAIAGLQEGLSVLFKLTRMDRVFRTHRSVADAAKPYASIGN